MQSHWATFTFRILCLSKCFECISCLLSKSMKRRELEMANLSSSMVFPTWLVCSRTYRRNPIYHIVVGYIRLGVEKFVKLTTVGAILSTWIRMHMLLKWLNTYEAHKCVYINVQVTWQHSFYNFINLKTNINKRSNNKKIYWDALQYSIIVDQMFEACPTFFPSNFF